MNNDIRKLIDDNWEDIKALVIEKAEAEQKLKPKTIWDLETKDRKEYYRIEASGFIEDSCFNAIYDKYVREAGNAFLTREEAEFEVERRKVESIMKKYARPFKMNAFNYVIRYNYSSDTVVTGADWLTNTGTVYFESEEIAKRVINMLGKSRLKEYWFGVTE
jgi:hypothetical protein